MRVTPGQYLVVVLEEGLHRARVSGLMLNIKDLPGVTQVTDMTAISQATLDVILRQPTPLLEQTDPSAYNAIRAYHARKRQPWLL
jgi:hypothetical protein